MTLRTLGLVAIVVLVTGCALDYGKESAPPADQIPLMVFHNVRQTGVKDGQISYITETEDSESYPSLKQVRLKKFRFREYDPTGAQTSEGEADAAVIDTLTNDAKISGRLQAQSKDQGVALVVDGGSSGGLTWTDESRILRTLPDTPVTLTKDDGSKIEARSLVLDLGSKRLDLVQGVEGTWTPEEHHHANTLGSPAPAGDHPVR